MMAASKPTSSLSVQPHILSTERYLGTLAAGLACLPLAREAYPPRTDSRVTPCGIRSLIEFGTLVWALVHPVLYLRRSAHEASPQAISGRTSYHGVLLVFRSYPQVIPEVFNLHGFGPSVAVKQPSTCSWVDHLGFGSSASDYGRPFRTRFRFASSAERLRLATDTNSQTH